MTRYVHQEWPKWCDGPEGEKRVFNDPQDVPAGWSYNTEAEGAVTVAWTSGPAKTTAPPAAPPPVPELDPPTGAQAAPETPKQKAARKAREARAAKKAAQQ
jgi:hypothetical protein